MSVAELMAAYLAHAARYYVDADGKPTKELGNMRAAIKPVRELYAETLAAEFGPRARRRPATHGRPGLVPLARESSDRPQSPCDEVGRERPNPSERGVSVVHRNVLVEHLAAAIQLF